MIAVDLLVLVVLVCYCRRRLRSRTRSTDRPGIFWRCSIGRQTQPGCVQLIQQSREAVCRGCRGCRVYRVVRRVCGVWSGVCGLWVSVGVRTCPYVSVRVGMHVLVCSRGGRYSGVTNLSVPSLSCRLSRPTCPSSPPVAVPSLKWWSGLSSEWCCSALHCPVTASCQRRTCWY